MEGPFQNSPEPPEQDKPAWEEFKAIYGQNHIGQFDPSDPVVDVPECRFWPPVPVVTLGSSKLVPKRTLEGLQDPAILTDVNGISQPLNPQGKKYH